MWRAVFLIVLVIHLSHQQLIDVNKAAEECNILEGIGTINIRSEMMSSPLFKLKDMVNNCRRNDEVLRMRLFVETDLENTLSIFLATVGQSILAVHIVPSEALWIETTFYGARKVRRPGKIFIGTPYINEIIITLKKNGSFIVDLPGYGTPYLTYVDKRDYLSTWDIYSLKSWRTSRWYYDCKCGNQIPDNSNKL